MFLYDRLNTHAYTSRETCDSGSAVQRIPLYNNQYSGFVLHSQRAFKSGTNMDQDICWSMLRFCVHVFAMRETGGSVSIASITWDRVLIISYTLHEYVGKRWQLDRRRTTLHLAYYRLPVVQRTWNPSSIWDACFQDFCCVCLLLNSALRILCLYFSMPRAEDLGDAHAQLLFSLPSRQLLFYGRWVCRDTDIVSSLSHRVQSGKHIDLFHLDIDGNHAPYIYQPCSVFFAMCRA